MAGTEPEPPTFDAAHPAGSSYPYLSWLSESVTDERAQEEPVEETAFDAAIFESLLHP